MPFAGNDYQETMTTNDPSTFSLPLLSLPALPGSLPQVPPCHVLPVNFSGHILVTDIGKIDGVLACRPLFQQANFSLALLSWKTWPVDSSTVLPSGTSTSRHFQSSQRLARPPPFAD